MRKIERSKDVLTADFPPNKVVFNTTTHKSYVLNDTASAVWDFCKGRKSIDDIIRHLVREYGIGMPVAKNDAARFVKDLEKRKLIKVRSI